MKRLATVLVLVAFALAGLGCETVKGVGRDMEKAGEAIQGYESAMSRGKVLIQP